MKNKPIIIVPGETESVFFEIFFKSLKKYHMRKKNFDCIPQDY